MSTVFLARTIAQLAVFVVVAQIGNRADILRKNKIPLAKGHGASAGSQIDWSNCKSRSAEKYMQPPYSLLKGNDCDPIWAGFGLGDHGSGRYVVKDARVFEQFFPDGKVGDAVTVEVTLDGAIALVLKGEFFNWHTHGTQRRL